MRFKGHAAQLQLVFFLLCEVTLTSLFRCTYKYLVEVPFLQTGTTKLADLLVTPEHLASVEIQGLGNRQLFAARKYESLSVKVQRLLEEPGYQTKRSEPFKRQ